MLQYIFSPLYHTLNHILPQITAAKHTGSFIVCRKLFIAFAGLMFRGVQAHCIRFNGAVFRVCFAGEDRPCLLLSG